MFKIELYKTLNQKDHHRVVHLLIFLIKISIYIRKMVKNIIPLQVAGATTLSD